MSVELKIRWDGEAPGLAEHRVSLGAFGEPLTLLLLAVRRIATQIVRTAVEGEAPETGRFSNLARKLDIELVNVEGNSAGVNAMISFHVEEAEAAVFADLPNRTASELLDAIDRETKGQPASGAVRKYLRSLPNGIRRQTYEVYDGGNRTKRVDIGAVRLAELPPDLPFLKEMEGNVVGVGFEPGKNEIRIRTENNSSVTLAAAPGQVERALEIRHEKVRTLSVHDGGKSRLIRLTDSRAPKFEVTREVEEEYIFGRWNDLLTRLAT